MQTKEQIKEMIEFAREQKLESIEIDGIKYTLGSNIGFPRSAIVPEMKPEEMVRPLSVLDEMSEEEIQYWATPWYDQLQAQKEELKNKKQIDDELKRAI